MSMHYTCKQSHVRHAPADVCLDGAMLEDNKQPAVGFGYGMIHERNANSLVSSLSPPQSSISSEMLSQSSLENLYDSDSHRSDNSSCSQAYFYNRFAYQTHGTHGSAPSYVESPDSLQGYPRGAHVAAQTPGLDASGGFSSGVKSMKHMLEELESELLGPDGDDSDSLELAAGDNSSAWTELLDAVPHADLPVCNASTSMQNWPNIYSEAKHGSKQEQWVPSTNLFPVEMMVANQGSQAKTLLVMCAAAIAQGNLAMAETIMQELRKKVSVYGDPIQRLAAYMSEGLVARLQASGLSLYRVLNCTEAPAAHVLSAMQKLYEICPYFKFAFMAANGAIAGALKDEAKVHIFDFQVTQGTQWMPLIQVLANRPGGPPCIRITTVDDKSAQGSPVGGLQLVKERLSNLAESLRVPFEFNSIPCRLTELQAYMIERREGEALAMNFTFQLHHIPDESVCEANPRDRLLRMSRSLNPKVLTLVEQEANTNTLPFLPRFIETMEYYSAVLDSIDVVLPRESKDRVNAEEQCLARDVVNLIACEGLERVERHELMDNWRARMMRAGFRPHPLSSYVNSTIKALLGSYSENYRLTEEGEALFLGWLSRPLVVASAWH